jgi:hypothetical protein
MDCDALTANKSRECIFPETGLLEVASVFAFDHRPVDVGLLALRTGARALVAVVGPAQALPFALGGRPLAFVGKFFSLVSQPLTVVGDSIALIGDPIPAASQKFASPEGGFALGQSLFALFQSVGPGSGLAGWVRAVVADHNSP